MLKDNLKNSKIDENMLDIYDLQLAKYGTEIVKYRRNFIRILSERAAEIQKSISGGREDLESGIYVLFRKRINTTRWWRRETETFIAGTAVWDRSGTIWNF